MGLTDYEILVVELLNQGPDMIGGILAVQIVKPMKCSHNSSLFSNLSLGATQRCKDGPSKSPIDPTLLTKWQNKF